MFCHRNFGPGKNGPRTKIFNENVGPRTKISVTVPFSDDEAKVFWPDGQALELKDVKRLTNYNPSLLNVCMNSKDINDAFQNVWVAVKKNTAGMMNSLRAQDALWYESNTPVSMEILYLAANGLSMSNDRLVLYHSTWLDVEGVTYAVKKDDADEVFYPKVNFPLIVQLYNRLCQKAFLGKETISGTFGHILNA